MPRNRLPVAIHFLKYHLWLILPSRVQIRRGISLWSIKSSFKQVYRSLSRVKSYRIPYLLFKNWFSRFKSEITSFWILTLFAGFQLSFSANCGPIFFNPVIFYLKSKLVFSSKRLTGIEMSGKCRTKLYFKWKKFQEFQMARISAE